jgi:excisionase family DNA binding protein
MRTNHSVALEVELEAVSRKWFTTTDVARALNLTTEGVRHLVRDQQLACTRTRSKRRLFREEDVLRLAAARDRARLRGVRVLRPKKFGLRDGPRQLPLFGLRKVK